MLPEVWTNDKVRREECHIPSDVEFMTKEELALGMIARAVHDNVPGHIVLADSFCGRSQRFRETVRALGLDYALGITAAQTMVAARQAREAHG